MKHKAPRPTRVEHHDVSTLASPSEKEKGLFESKAKEEQIKKEFEFSDLNVEHFSAKVGGARDKDQKDRDFIKGNIYKIMLIILFRGWIYHE